jgi:hypothetical protein
VHEHYEMCAEFLIVTAPELFLRAATRGSGRVCGARTRIRTRDQLIKSQLLYQLSYAGAPVFYPALPAPASLFRPITPSLYSTRATMLARL